MTFDDVVVTPADMLAARGGEHHAEKRGILLPQLNGTIYNRITLHIAIYQHDHYQFGYAREGFWRKLRVARCVETRRAS